MIFEDTTYHVCGDLIIDWVIHEGQVHISLGGVGNVCRGLGYMGRDIDLLTVWNPALYPVAQVAPLVETSIQDPNYQNVSVRNYDTGIFLRYKSGLRPGIFSVSADIAVLHEESCVKEVRDAFYVDARDPYPKGSTRILRLSSDNDWKEIMKRWDYYLTLVTYADRVEVFSKYGLQDCTVLRFREVPEAIDTVGAGDVFSVGFLSSLIDHPESPVIDHIEKGVILAQQKVQEVGVFLNGLEQGLDY